MIGMIVGVAAALAIGHTLPAQETTGRLQGRVLTDNRVPIVAASVVVSSRSLQVEREVRVTDQGYFTAYALTPGEYRVHVRALGFRELVAERVIIGLGITTSLGNITMRRADIVLDPVVVTYDATAVDPLSTEIASRIDVRVAERLPTGRDYQSVLLLLPQVQPGQLHRDGLNVAGSTGLENAYYIDGMNVTEGYRNSGGTNLPHSFIAQVEVKTGGYEAEFGRALGGIVSVTTRSGTNTPFVSAFSYYTASSLSSSSARSTFDFGTGRFARHDVGVAVGGPIVRDRLWYFGAYDIGVAREQVGLPGGSQTDHTRADQFAGKLTWRPDRRSNVNVTVVGDPSKRDVVGHTFWGSLPIKSLANADPYLGYWDVGGIASSVAANRTFGQHLLIEALASWGSFRDRTGPRTARGAAEPLLIDFVTGEWSGGYGNQWDRTSTRAAASVAATYETGAHSAKLGLQYEDNRQKENWQWINNGPDGAGAIMRATPDQYIGLVLDLRTRTRSRVPSLFAQTSLLAHDRVRFNAGLRWDGQYFDSPTTGRSGSITDQLQPRLGLIVYPTGSPSQKVTASFGRFYEQVPNLPITWYWGGLHQRLYFYDHDPRVDPSGGSPYWWDEVPAADIKGQHYDELTLGYERVLPASMTGTVRASRRRLREVLAMLTRRALPETPPEDVLANPGRGEFAHLPRAVSRYDAIEISLSRLTAARHAFMLSYVWSRKYGNYVGLFDQDNGNPNAHASGVTPSTGLLPNDRTHVLKALGSYRVGRDLTLGATFEAQSGTPLSELAARAVDNYFLGQRGSAGRTPALWDLNLRAAYDAGAALPIGSARIVVDVLHVFSRRKPTRLNQVRYLATDASGTATDPNPFYRSGLQFQPPMTLRLGVELGSEQATGTP